MRLELLAAQWVGAIGSFVPDVFGETFMLYTHPAAVVLATFDHPRSRANFDAVASDMGVDAGVAEAARENLRSNAVQALVISGPQASGKDTVGPAVLAALGASEHTRVGIADGLKQEVSDLLLMLPSHASQDSAVHAAAELLDITSDHAQYLVSELWGVASDPSHGLTGWSRTTEIRRVLQYLGNEARVDDPTRYVRIAVPRILGLLAEGVSVYMGDGRFPREAAPCRELGMFLVRLHVDPEVKAARLLARDGIIADPKTLHHEGESALDDWPGVDLRVDNSHASRAEVVSVVSGAFAMHQSRLHRELA
jgi:hypothetical protein